MLTTPRLLLRPWQPADRASLVALNADPAVLRYFPALMSPADTDAMLERIHAHFEQHGYGLWAAELRATGECIGYIGLNIPRFQLPFSPCVEIGWRLAAAHWNQGLATEGALAALEYGFGTLGLPEIVSFTTTANLPSRRVMEKIGMTHNQDDDFDHPALPEAHPLRRHVLYRRSRNG